MSTVLSRSSARDFDFLMGEWNIHNRRQTRNGEWEEFHATSTVTQVVDGLVQLDHYEAPACPSRGHVKAVTVRTYDKTTGQWSLVWLSNYAPPDFRPVVGTWQGDEGEFFQTIETDEGEPLDVRYLWKQLGPNDAYWEQSFSLDGGSTWDVNWTMDLTRALPDAA